jgi:serine/threonine protein kinase
MSLASQPSSDESPTTRPTSAQLCGAVVTSGTGQTYLLRRLLQASLFGCIYEAIQQTKGQSPKTSEMKSERFVIKVTAWEEARRARDDALTAEDAGAEWRLRAVLVGSPHVLTPLEVFREGPMVFFVSAYAQHGDLQAHLGHVFREPEARFLFRQLLAGLDAMHSKRVAWRDVSLENILLFGSDADAAVRVALCDPGQALHNVEECVGICAKAFRPPEVYSAAAYNPFLVDAFCCGWVLHALLTGRPPFARATPDDAAWLETFARRQVGPYASQLSAEAQDLLVQLLDPDPARRLPVSAAVSHAWLSQDEEAVTGSSLTAYTSPVQVATGDAARVVNENRGHLEHWRQEERKFIETLRTGAPFRPAPRGILSVGAASEPSVLEDVKAARDRINRLLALKTAGWGIVDRMDAPELDIDAI